MKKIVSIAVALVVGVLVFVPWTLPANAASDYPLCVTTTWRAKHTGMPKTRPGHVCIRTLDMWVPKSWHYLDCWYNDTFCLVQRPPIVRNRKGA